MPATVVNRIASTLGAVDHPYVTGAWTPNFPRNMTPPT